MNQRKSHCKIREGRPINQYQATSGKCLQSLETHTYMQVEEMKGVIKRTLIRRKNERKWKK
ncbi:hypothetical protein [Cytobacillus oceanisediminis]|uniref:hypothetical protein n=1 Tax=Cytobacillus oceanisediminis TaxID=665099 RepID=UPI0021B517FB|nr:hypothetical protein [Cytobacillus oceanisediminis]